MENVLVLSYSGRGFISHDDQEQDGLSFQVIPILDGKAIVLVDGVQEKISAWMSRVGGMSVTEGKKKTLIEDAEQKGLEDSVPIEEAELNSRKSRLAALKARGGA